MTRIAHLSDLHLNGTEERRSRLMRALDKAIMGRSTHLVLTGDLTADGTDAQMSELSSALYYFSPEDVTIVPGNHDLGDKDWRTALRTSPLGRYAPTSEPGAVTDLGDSVIAAISTQYPKRAFVFRALGQVSEPELRVLERLAHMPARPVIVAMHHGPQWHPLQFFDGLTNREKVIDILRRAPHMVILCGHDHRALDLQGGRVFTAASVADHDDPLRLYDVVGGRVVPIYRSVDPGRYL